MEQKRVSFAVAKAIKEAGYPQAETDEVYRNDGCLDSHSKWIGGAIDVCCDVPTYLDVWLWLWREKNIRIKDTHDGAVWIWGIYKLPLYIEVGTEDPEESIIAAIEYIVEHKLLK